MDGRETEMGIGDREVVAVGGKKGMDGRERQRWG